MKYIKEGYGKSVILLHGWGCNKTIFNRLIKDLKDKYCFYSLDLPGFGESSIEIPLSVEEYGDILHRFIKKNNIDSPIILGHSFGGRVAINYASRYYCEKLILVDSAGIKRFKYKVLEYKVKRRLLQTFRMNSKIEQLREKYSSTDYKNSNEVLRETLKKAVKYDQKHEMKNIVCETLIIWGKRDQDTKVADAKVMKRLIRNSEIVLFETGHYPFLEDGKKFKLVLDSFLKVN